MLDLRPNFFDCLIEQPQGVGFLTIERERPAFQAADIEQFVDETGQPRRLGVYDIQKSLLAFEIGDFVQCERFGIGLDVGERRPQLMGRAVHEVIPRLFRQLLLTDIANLPELRRTTTALVRQRLPGHPQDSARVLGSPIQLEDDRQRLLRKLLADLVRRGRVFFKEQTVDGRLGNPS